MYHGLRTVLTTLHGIICTFISQIKKLKHRRLSKFDQMMSGNLVKEPYSEILYYITALEVKSLPSHRIQNL